MPIKWVKVELVEDDMVLGQPVEDEMGRVLLARGEALRASYRERLAAWGIHEVAVEIPDDGLPIPAASSGPLGRSGSGGLSDSQVIKVTDLRLRQRFAPYAGDEIMETIQRVARRKLVRRRTEEGPDGDDG